MDPIDIAVLVGLVVAVGAWIWKSRRSEAATGSQHQPPSDSWWGDGGGVDGGGGPA